MICQNRIHTARVYVGSQLCGKLIYGEGSDSVYTVKCPTVLMGSSVRIIQDYNYLSLCEVTSFELLFNLWKIVMVEIKLQYHHYQVQVWVADADMPKLYTNVALTGTATTQVGPAWSP